MKYIQPIQTGNLIALYLPAAACWVFNMYSSALKCFPPERRRVYSANNNVVLVYRIDTIIIPVNRFWLPTEMIRET